jgi:uncharacterized protein GlcG (DUF336 family)
MISIASLGLAEARLIADAAQAYAEANDWQVAITVVDAS